MNKIGWAQNRISKTIKSSLHQAKNQISFSNRCTFKSTAGFLFRINSTSDDQSARTQVLFSKMSKCSSSNFEKLNTFWKFPCSAIQVWISLFHVKLDLIVLAGSKTTFENKSALNGLHRKQNYSLKTSFVLQNRIERVLSQHGNQLTKMNNVWRSQNLFWKKHLNLRRAIPKTKIHSVKIVHLITLFFSGKLTSNTIHYFSEFNSIFTAEMLELKYQTWKQERWSRAENKITLWKIVPCAKLHPYT